MTTTGEEKKYFGFDSQKTSKKKINTVASESFKHTSDFPAMLMMQLYYLNFWAKAVLKTPRPQHGLERMFLMRIFSTLLQISDIGFTIA